MPWRLRLVGCILECVSASGRGRLMGRITVPGAGQPGAQEPCLGVKVEDMKKIQKRVKMDYQLALDLYDTGIADAMYLAGLIADDAKMTKKDLQKWVENATWGMVGEYTVPWVASSSPHGREIALKWMESKDEAVASSGWGTYSSMVAIKE